ncbi:MAG: hypothetical protein K2R93_13595 [Gemmatimonadaceae bacterium]|nr:hypothetical protein [Gemmatimonadaceae bacterium]
MSTSLTLTVTASGGGSGNVNWTFCASDRFPTWFAVQNGTSGSWTTITPTGSSTRVYNFSVSSVGGVAYAIARSGGGTDVTVQYGTATEFTNSGAQECTTNKARQNLTGTVAGLALGTNTATIALGNVSASPSANGPYTITNGPLGTTDLVAVRSAINLTTFTSQPDRVVFRRNVNYTSTIPAIDFGTEGVAPASGTYTITNLAGENFTQAAAIFTTANGSAGSFSSVSISGAAALTVYGIPNSLLTSGDQHLVTVSAMNSSGSTISSYRSVLLYNQQIANRSVTLGAAAPALTPASLGSSPYVRFSASGTWSSEYGDALGIGYTQSTTGSNSWTVTMTRGYTGASSSWTMTLPDFSGVSGFQTSWGLASSSTNWAFTQTGIVNGFNSGTGKFDEGALVKLASRSGTVSP